ncbi:hypothetical protein, conserved [Leishmania tarentolae]|uniref:Flagellar attachment zone protein 1 conserved domain-containing protein n=1 Tax=Leishmania tarentolae TaxID=5689 RepID=A0A640KSR6_LEITA|nr:hypothetical protein, conserved [Leishmania tarentolae]
MAVPAVREFWQCAEEPEDFSGRDLTAEESVALRAQEDALHEGPISPTTAVPAVRELWQCAEEPEDFSGSDLAAEEPVALRAHESDESAVKFDTESPRSGVLFGRKTFLEEGHEGDCDSPCSASNASDSRFIQRERHSPESTRRSLSGVLVDEKAAGPWVTQHKVTLDGRYWAMVIYPPVVAEAFRQDVANALDVRLVDVQHVELACGNLVGTFEVVHTLDLLSAFETDEKLRAYSFPLTWEHYPRMTDATKNQDFENDARSPLRRTSRCINSSSKCRLPVEDTESSRHTSTVSRGYPLTGDTQETSRSTLSSGGGPLCGNTDIPAMRENLSGVRAVDEAPHVTETGTLSSKCPSLERHHTGDDENESLIELSPETAPVPIEKAMKIAVYPVRLSTKHRVGFVGNHWCEILKTQKNDFLAAFVKGTSERLGYEPDSVTKVQCNESTGETIVSFQVTHSSILSREEIDSKLRSAPYADVWKLYYKSVPPEEGKTTPNNVTTFHRLGFVGSKWREVWSSSRARFLEVFAADTATALNVAPQAVKVVDHAVADDIVVNFYVTHPETDSAEVIDAKLEQFDYQQVWDLYGSPNKVDEQQRVVPCVMKSCSASRRTSPPSPSRRRLPTTNSSSQMDSVCPRCQQSFSLKQEYLQRDESSGWHPQSMHSRTSSISDAVRTTVVENSYSAICKPSLTPPLPPLAHPYGQHERSERQASRHLYAPQKRGTSLSRGAPTSLRAPGHPSANRGLIPHTPRKESLGNSTRYRQRRVNLRDLESELSRKQRQRKHQELDQQLDLELRRFLNCSKSSLSNDTTALVSGSFLPPIVTRYTKVCTPPQHMETQMGPLLE